MLSTTGLRFLAPISLGLAIYYHYQSVQERAPTYYVSPTRTRIVDTSIAAPPQMQVLYKGKDLNENVSAAIVYLWTDGKLPIRAGDVLEPVRIELDPGCNIIDARILKISRPVTKLVRAEVSDTARNVIPLSFEILERNDGAVLQVIYTGKPDANVSATGTIVGVDHFEKVLERHHHNVERLLRLEKYIDKFFAVVSVVGAIFVLLTRKRLAERFGRAKLRFVVGVVVFNLLAYTFVTIADYREDQPVVPATLWGKN